jgi:hypothetical protein
VTGTRYQNDKNRDRQEARHKADAFMTKLKTLTPHLKSAI